MTLVQTAIQLATFSLSAALVVESNKNGTKDTELYSKISRAMGALQGFGLFVFVIATSISVLRLIVSTYKQWKYLRRLENSVKTAYRNAADVKYSVRYFARSLYDYPVTRTPDQCPTNQSDLP